LLNVSVNVNMSAENDTKLEEGKEPDDLSISELEGGKVIRDEMDDADNLAAEENNHEDDTPAPQQPVDSKSAPKRKMIVPADAPWKDRMWEGMSVALDVFFQD
jgi:hypothetical protein